MTISLKTKLIKFFSACGKLYSFAEMMSKNKSAQYADAAKASPCGIFLNSVVALMFL